MLKADFITELRRWFSGARCESDLTKERADAWWDRYQHEPLPRWKSAITGVLLDPGRPSVARIDRMLEEIEAQEERDRISHNRGGGLGTALEVALRSSFVSDAYRDATRRSMMGAAEGLTPRECAVLLAEDAHLDPDTDFSGWIRGLERDKW